MLRGITSAVIRDKKGKLVAVCNACLDMVQDVLSAEALALKHGLFLAESVACNRVVVSSDNSELIEIMKNERPSIGFAAAIVHDCFSKEPNYVRIKHRRHDEQQQLDQAVLAASLSIAQASAGRPTFSYLQLVCK
ncbi:hypothetical protein D1007_22871 [Hordeum vulgare]|nr:hypothetical protein D1007_22871 [Hordeum vulgare]